MAFVRGPRANLDITRGAQHRFATRQVGWLWIRAIIDLVVDDAIENTNDVFETCGVALAPFDSLPIAIPFFRAGFDVRHPGSIAARRDAGARLAERADRVFTDVAIRDSGSDKHRSDRYR